MDVSFVIPARDAAETLTALVESIRAQVTSLRTEIIVVDNCSTDGTGELARRLGVRVLLATPLGAGAARNVGARAARGTYLAFLDADVELDPHWLAALLGPMQEQGFLIGVGQIIPIGPAGFFHDYRRKLNVARYAGTYISVNSPGGVSPVVNTAACVYHRDLFLLSGGFDERLKRLEDTEFSERAVTYCGAIFASSRARAFVKNTGSAMSYVQRSFVLGQAKAQFAELSKTASLVGHVRSYVGMRLLNFEGRDRIFYVVNFIANTLGYCCQRLQGDALPVARLNPAAQKIFRRHWRLRSGDRDFELGDQYYLVRQDDDYHFLSLHAPPVIYSGQSLKLAVGQLVEMGTLKAALPL